MRNIGGQVHPVVVVVVHQVLPVDGLLDLIVGAFRVEVHRPREADHRQVVLFQFLVNLPTRRALRLGLLDASSCCARIAIVIVAALRF